MDIISRKEAKEKNLTYYFTGESCKRGHICRRWVAARVCVECNAIFKKKWRETHKQEQHEYYKKTIDRRKKYSLENKEKRKIQRAESYQRNKKHELEYNKQYWAKHKDRLTEHYKKKRKDNREDFNRKALEYYYKSPISQLRHICQTTAKRLSLGKITGGKLKLLYYTHQEFIEYLLNNTKFKTLREAWDAEYHIDHIVPLQYIVKHINNDELKFCIAMDLQNLRLIPAKENISKLNKINDLYVQKIIRYLWLKYGLTFD